MDPGEVFVSESTREIEQAVSALTVELLKLSPLEGEARAALSVTIENALSRLALAILAQTAPARSEPAPDKLQPAALVA
jgi:hypothetical protein